MKKSITIGKRKYRVEKVDLIEKNLNLLGVIMHDKQKILLQKNSKKVEDETLFHEIAHGIIVDLAIKGNEEGLQKKYLQFFRDLNNSEAFIEYLGKVLGGIFKIK